jgi:hypothetical protein
MTVRTALDEDPGMEPSDDLLAEAEEAKFRAIEYMCKSVSSTGERQYKSSLM